MKELLRVTMSAAQVREACELWAMARSHFRPDDADARAVFSDESMPGNMVTADVIFTKRRIRKSKLTVAEAARVLAAPTYENTKPGTDVSDVEVRPFSAVIESAMARDHGEVK